MLMRVVCLQGLQRESTDRQAARERLERDLHEAQEANQRLQETIDGFLDEISKAHEGYVPVAELDVANGRIASLVKDLEEAKAASISSAERAKTAVAAAEEEHKATDSIIVGLHNEQTALEKHVKENCHKLLGQSDPVVQTYNASQCMTAVVNAATASALCVQAALQGMSPTEVIPGGLTEVWRYLEEVPAIVEWMMRSAFRHKATTALSLVLTHFPDDFDLDDVTSGYPSANGTVEMSEVLKVTAKAAPYADRVLAIGDLLPYQETVLAPSNPESEHHDMKSEQPFRSSLSKSLRTYPTNPWQPFVRVKGGGAASSSGLVE